MEVPKIVSVDDHVVEPAHVWQTWLPEKHRALGPRVERKRWAPFVHHPGAKYTNIEDPEGEWGDAWYYEDRLIYVHKKFVAIPLSATPDGDVAQLRPHGDDDDAGHLRRHAAGLLRARRPDRATSSSTGSTARSRSPRSRGSAGRRSTRRNDKELALACVRAYNDWMVEEWCEPSGGMNIPLCIMPLWDVDLAVAEIRRNAERGVRAFCFSELPTRLEPPEHPHRPLGPGALACQRHRRHAVHAHRVVVERSRRRRPTRPRASAARSRSTTRWRRSPTGCSAGSCRSSRELKLAYSEGQIGWIPYALERADTVWDQHDAWQHSKEIIPEPPSTYYYGRIFGCFTADRVGLDNLERVGVDNICFETDYPHTDTTWPNSKEYVEKMVADAGLDDETAYKVLRGNAIRMLELDRT